MLRVFMRAAARQRMHCSTSSSLLSSLKSTQPAADGSGDVKTADGIFLTDDCVERIHEQNKADSAKPFLRLKVVSGGCQGAMYEFDWDNEVREGDHSFEKGGARLIIDDSTFETVRGSEVCFAYIAL